MLNKKPIFCIIGRTLSGKDTIVQAVCKDLNLKSLISYTTRPIRPKEGNTHIFINAQDLDKYRDIIAYTKIGQYEYFATKQQLYENDFYIIDPTGFVMLLDNKDLCQEFDFISIYIFISEETRNRRALSRGDDSITYQNRIKSENGQFWEFENNHTANYTINNDNDLQFALNELEKIVQKELGKNNRANFTEFIPNF